MLEDGLVQVGAQIAGRTSKIAAVALDLPHLVHVPIVVLLADSQSGVLNAMKSSPAVYRDASQVPYAPPHARTRLATRAIRENIQVVGPRKGQKTVVETIERASEEGGMVVHDDVYPLG